jgi:CheY-like chemotaxis protein
MSMEVTPRPLTIPPPPPADQATARAVRRVLVVDDDADIRASLAELLEDSGYSVAFAEDGRQAFDYLDQQPAPDCVVLDLWMPEMDGWSLASYVLQGRLPAVPILVVTAASAQYAYPVPPRYVLRKPVNPDRLLMLVAELMKTRPTGPVE